MNNLKYTLIFFLCFMIIFISAVFYIAFHDMFDYQYKRIKIEHPKTRDSIIVIKALCNAPGSHPSYLISSIKPDNNAYYDSLSDYFYLGEDAVQYYAFTDSSLVFFVGIISNKPPKFKSKAQIEQKTLVDNEYLLKEFINNNKAFYLEEQFRNLEWESQ